MIKEAIDKILELSMPQQVQIHGLEYSSKGLNLVKPPVMGETEISTLDGLVNLLEAGFDEFDPAKTFIHVESHELVTVQSLHSTKYAQRRAYIKAKPLTGVTGFTFNRFSSQEDFVIGLQAAFQPTPDLAEVLELASRVDLTEKIRLEDSGVAQQMQVNKGIAFKEERVVKARVSLAPYRTFRELDQPVSDFIFRAKDGGQFALFEADGGAWKIAAVNAIATWLMNRIRTSEKTDLQAIPIIS